MGCEYHKKEQPVDKCRLCCKPICLECIVIGQELGFSTLCPKCLRAMTGCWIEIECDDSED